MSEIKSVYVLHGKTRSVDFTMDEEGNYLLFERIYGVYETYESAYKDFEKHVKEAFDDFINYPPLGLDWDLVDKTKEVNLFDDYNLGKEYDEYEEGDVQWEFFKSEGYYAHWQMFAVKVPYGSIYRPVLPGMFIKKVEVQK